jgi:hypothetical protein
LALMNTATFQVEMYAKQLKKIACIKCIIEYLRLFNDLVIYWMTYKRLKYLLWRYCWNWGCHVCVWWIWRWTCQCLKIVK